MMYKYSLEKNSKKYVCPKCGQKKLVRYINIETNSYIGNHVGRCDREINCGYHFPPKLYFESIGEKHHPVTYSNFDNTKTDTTSFHSIEDLKGTLKDHSKNNFINFLKENFDLNKVRSMLKDYQIGTINTWYNSTVFWQVDEEYKIRGGKIISYTNTGKRTKYINWVHSIQLKKNNISHFKLEQCLFGLHLINNSQKAIAIVESEKTACIMSLLFEKYLWLATGSLNGLTIEKLQVLRNYKIILYPDLGLSGKNGSPFEQWQSKCNHYQKQGFDIKISKLLEDHGSEKQRIDGYDIADYFIDQKNKKPKKIISRQEQKYIDFYMKNRSLKTLIDVFDLYDENGNKINYL